MLICTLAIFLQKTGVNCAPEPRNVLFENGDLPLGEDGDIGVTTEIPSELQDPVTSVEYVLRENNNLDEGSEDLLTQPSENIVASASSVSSATTSANSLTGATTGSGGTKINTQANLQLLLQLQEQLRRQQQIQKLAANSLNLVQAQSQQVNSIQQLPQQQFSLDALVKSFVKVFQVAKTKIDQGARTVRDIMAFFDKKKYVGQASENNLVMT